MEDNLIKNTKGAGSLNQREWPGLWQVLCQPELLESILLHLPLRDLLHSQRVCQGLKKLVETNAKLQQALFFQGERQPSESNLNKNIESDASTPRPNPLLQKYFHTWFEESDRPGSSWLHNGFYDRLPWGQSKRQRDTFARSEATWRKMFTAQPPTLSIEVFKTTEFNWGDVTAAGLFAPKGGVTMGQIYDLIWQSILRNPESGVSFRISGTLCDAADQVVSDGVSSTHEVTNENETDKDSLCFAVIPTRLYFKRYAKGVGDDRPTRKALDRSAWFKSDAHQEHSFILKNVM